MALTLSPNPDTLTYRPSDQAACRFWDTLPTQQVPSHTKVPSGFPARLESPLTWSRSIIESKRSEWIVTLDKEDVREVEAALQSLEQEQVDYTVISQDTFRLSDALHGRLRRVSDTLYNGVGITILKGLDPSRYSQAQNVKIFAGITAHIAPQRGFVDWNREKVLAHVLDVRRAGNCSGPITPGFTSSSLCFHTENCEILALFAVDVADSHGRTLLSSSFQLYNELASRRPDILHTLADAWVSESFQKDHPPMTMPFLHRQGNGDGALLRFSRLPLTGFGGRKRDPALPPLTAAQIEALDAVQLLAERESIALPTQKGDIVLVNDMAVMHGREGYTDGADNLVKRYLLKMVLRDPAQNSCLPESLRDVECHRVYGPNCDDGSRAETWDAEYKSGLENCSFRNG